MVIVANDRLATVIMVLEKCIFERGGWFAIARM